MLLKIAKWWKQPKCPSVNEWIKKLLHLHNGILCCRNKEEAPTLGNSIHGTGEYYAKWIKPGGERQIYDHTCRGALSQPPVHHGWRISLPRHDLLGEERWLLLSKEKGPEPFPLWAFIRFISTGIQMKLTNHCQAVRVKQYITYRELWGLILSYSQLVKGL